MCKHIISLAILLRKVEYPAINLNIEGNRKRGRPAKAKSALERQLDKAGDDDELVESATDNLAENAVIEDNNYVDDLKKLIWWRRKLFDGEKIIW